MLWMLNGVFGSVSIPDAPERNMYYNVWQGWTTRQRPIIPYGG